MPKDKSTLSSDIGSKFPDNTTGLITAAILRSFLGDITDKFTNKWFVDSVNGNDATGDGRNIASPFKTISKLMEQTIATGDTIYLARGSHWREFLDLSNKTAITVKAYGNGHRPILDASDIAANNQFSLTAGRTNTYQINWTPLHGQGGVGGDVLSIWEDGTRLIRRTSIDQVEANPGSFFTVYPLANTSQIVYIHPYESTNPTTNNRVYEITKRYCGIQLFNDCVVESIHTRNNGGNNGGFYGGAENLAIDCLFEDGTKHNAFMISGEFRDCAFFKAEDGPNHMNGTMSVFYAPDPTGMTGIFTRCKFIGGNGNEYSHPNGLSALYAHGAAGFFYKNIYVIDCEIYNVGSTGGVAAETVLIENLKAKNCSSFVIGSVSSQQKVFSVRNSTFVQKPGVTLPAVNISSFTGTLIQLSGLYISANTFGGECIRVTGNGTVDISKSTIIGVSVGIALRTISTDAPTIKMFDCVVAKVNSVTTFASASTIYIGDNNCYLSNTPRKLTWNYKGTNYTGLNAFKQAYPKIEQKSLMGSSSNISSNPATEEVAFFENSIVHALEAGHQYQKNPFHFSEIKKEVQSRLLVLPGEGIDPGNTVVPNVATFAPSSVGATSHWAARLTVAITGTNVTQINDMIGTNHLVQGTPANQPQFVSKDLDLFGYSSISFDGARQWIKGAIPTAVQPSFFMAVLSCSTLGYLFDGNTFNSGAVMSGSNATGFSIRINAGASLNPTPNTKQNNFFILSWLFNGATSKIWINGSLLITGNAGASNPAGITVGTRGDGATSTGDASTMKLAELIFIPSEPTPTNHNYLGTNLAFLYGGLPWSIPS